MKKYYMQVLVLATLSSCCLLPFADCSIKVKELIVKPTVIDIKKDGFKNCIIKAWLLSSRNRRYDTSTIDLTIRFLYESSLHLDTINSVNLFKKDSCYLKVGSEKIFVQPNQIRSRINLNENPALKEVEYYFSLRILQKFLNPGPLYLVLKSLNFSREFEDKIDINVAIYDN